MSVATIRNAIDSGVNLIDTAPVYGFGRSEEIVKILAIGADDLRRIDALLVEHMKDPVGPEFMAPPRGRITAPHQPGSRT